MSAMLNRRRFMQSAAAVSAGFMGLSHVTRAWASGSIAVESSTADRIAAAGYGALVPDPQKVLDLPAGFTYKTIAHQGMLLDDGLVLPAKADGAAAFTLPGLPPEIAILIVNHECEPHRHRHGAFGWSLERLGGVPRESFYDYGRGRKPGLGGTSTHVYNTRTGRVEKRYMSLLGTERNCAGGPTPWNSWITCEETTSRADDDLERDHGYNFEVPASVGVMKADPVPLIDMGRFYHEAVAVDPATGIVYQTEDRQDGSFYRFIPKVKGKLHEGGRLQALVVIDQPSLDTRNWTEAISAEDAAVYAKMGKQAVIDRNELSSGPVVAERVALDVKWVDVENVTAPEDDLRYQSHANGAARFARGEGMWWGEGCAYFACTSGGPNRKGQVWRYVPSRLEGQRDEDRFPGRLELYLEPNDHGLVKNADNLVVAPWGDLILCEDSGTDNRLVGITSEGTVYPLAFNALSQSEFAGSCFSPDGTTMFVSSQSDGVTFAITGPWRR